MPHSENDLEILAQFELYFSIRHTSRAMRLFAEVMDFDYDAVIIFLTVAEACFQSVFHLAPMGHGGVDIERTYSGAAQSGLSTTAIGEITGIPRETVRRKIKKLVDDKCLAISDTTKNVYLPASIVISDRFYSKFKAHIAEAEQLVKTIRFYQRDL